MYNYAAGVVHALDVLGLKTAALSTPALLPSKTLRTGVRKSEKLLSPLKSHSKVPYDVEHAMSHPGNTYQEVMGPGKYSEPATSKALRYRVFEQTPKELRRPLHYAV